MLDTYVVSTKLSLPPSEVPSIVEAWHRNLPRTTVAGRSLCRAGSGFQLADTPQLPSCDPLELYRVRGFLWVSARPIRVTLEFSTWSADVSQAALRPSHLAWPVQTERYERRVAGVLNEVVASVTTQHVPLGARARGMLPRPAWLPPLVGLLLG